MIKDMKFLVVDDFSTMRRIIRSLLKELGCTDVSEAEDGAIALQSVRIAKESGHGFDFVISDINMPNMNGFHFLRAVRADEGLRHIPFLMVTAEDREEDIMMAVQLGAAGYIVKPFTKATLEEKLEKILQKLAKPE